MQGRFSRRPDLVSGFGALKSNACADWPLPSKSLKIMGLRDLSIGRGTFSVPIWEHGPFPIENRCGARCRPRAEMGTPNTLERVPGGAARSRAGTRGRHPSRSAATVSSFSASVL